MTQDPRKHRSVAPFPVYAGQHESTCGVACLAMIAEWVTRRPQYEVDWARIAGARTRGLTADEIVAALEAVDGPLAGLIAVRKCCSAQDDPPGWRRWRRGHRTRPPITGADRVYLLRIDAYDERGQHQGHWIVTYGCGRRRSASGEARWVVLIADPDGGVRYGWDWRSMVEAQVLDVIEVRRICRRKR